MVIKRTAASVQKFNWDRSGLILELTSTNLGLQPKTSEHWGPKQNLGRWGRKDRLQDLYPQCLLETLHETKSRGMCNRIYGQLTLRVET